MTFFLAFLCLISSCLAADQLLYARMEDGGVKFEPEMGPGVVAAIQFDNTGLFKNGWNKMHGMILPNSGRDGAVGWGCEAATGASLKPKQKDWEFAMGALEAHAFYKETITHLKHYKAGVCEDFGEPDCEDWPQVLSDYLVSNYLWTKDMIEDNPNDEYWQQVDLVVARIEGMAFHFNDDEVSLFDLWTMNAWGDMDDLAVFLPLRQSEDNKRSNDWYDVHHHCTGLTSRVDDDVFLGHTTWSSYLTMNRILKNYVTLGTNGRYKSAILFPSYPASVFSGDDFYVTAQGLGIIETTMHTFNTSLYENCNPQQLLTFVRVMVANSLAKTSPQWHDLFARYNSGTYNNEWTVVDYKHVSAATISDTVVIGEQFPGHYRYEDNTERLEVDNYLPSINTPRWDDYFKMSGYPEKIKESGDHGSYWSYFNCSRYHILKEKHSKVDSIESFGELLRYNNYENDFWSFHDPAQSIASRYDLRDDRAWGKANIFGAVSTAVVNKQLARELSFLAISSPPSSDNANMHLPVWEFGVPPFENIDYEGMPKRWDFQWEKFSFQDCRICVP